MRLLLANPNTSSEATEALLTLARRSASLGTEIVGATGRFGASLMRSPAERAIGVHALLDAVAENADECDAIVVGAFGDYGSAAAATLLGKPVVNLASAAFTTIKWLARPFSIVTLSQAMANDLRKEADANGAGELLVGIYAVERSPTDPEFRDTAVASVGKIEGADLVLPVGPPLAAIFDDIAIASLVPLIDSVACAVRLAEAAAHLNPVPPPVSGVAAGQHHHGLSPALQRVLSRSRPIGR